jgi:hypothetical protein
MYLPVLLLEPLQPAHTRRALRTVRTAHAPRRCGRPNQPLATACRSATEQAHCQIVTPRLRDAEGAVVDARLEPCSSVRVVFVMHHAFTVLVEQPERGVQRSAADGGRAEGIGVADVNGVDIDIVGAADGAANLRDGVAACALRGFGQVARVAAAVVRSRPSRRTADSRQDALAPRPVGEVKRALPAIWSTRSLPPVEARYARSGQQRRDACCASADRVVSQSRASRS